MIFSRMFLARSKHHRDRTQRLKSLLSSKGVFIVLAVSVGILILPNIGLAAENGWIEDLAAKSFLFAVNGTISILLKLVGGLLTTLIDILVKIASYNDFLDAQGIKLGWAVVRDIGNMFLVMIFLVIAFGTVFRIQGLEYKSTLVKFFMMTILANFSYTFAGLMIDIAQALMQTFVNAFQETAASLLVSGFGVKSILDLAKLSNNDSFIEALATPIVAIIFLVIAVMTILALVVILIARIVMLWILTVLSPMPWILNILPSTSKYASQWWQEWTKNLITGPVLAFFLWLAFMMIRLVDAEAMLKKSTVGGVVPGGGPNSFLSSGLGTTGVVNYIIAIGLLMGGMMMAQQIGGAGGKFAGSMYQAGGKVIGALGGLKPMASWAAAKIKAGEVPGKIPFTQKKIGDLVRGIELNPVNAYKNIQAGRKLNREKLDRLGTAEAGDRMRTVGGRRGLVYGLGTPDIGPQYMTVRGFKNRMLWQKGAFGEARKTRSLRPFFHGAGSGADIRGRDERISKLEAQAEGPEKAYRENYVSWKQSKRANEGMETARASIPALNAAMTAADEGEATEAQNALISEHSGRAMEWAKAEAEGELNLWEATPERKRYNTAYEWVGDRLEENTSDLDRRKEQIERDIKDKQGKANDARIAVSNTQKAGGDSRAELELLRKIEKAIKKKNDEKAAVDKDIQARKVSLKDFGHYKDVPFATESDKVKKRQQLEDARKRKESSIGFQAQDFEARNEWRTATSKSQQNVRTSNEFELVRLFSSAMANKDRSMAAAVLMQASEVGHLNELLEGTTGKDGKKYNATATDFNRFVNEQLIGNLGMSQQMAYMTQNDAAEKAQKGRHWIFAQTNEMDGQGNWTQRDAHTQEAAATIEMAKVNPQSASRETGRFGYFNEVINEQGERQTQWTAMGVQQLKRTAVQFFDGLEKDTNKSVIEHMAAPQNLAVTFQIIDDIANGKSHIGTRSVVDIKNFLEHHTTGGGAKEIETELEALRKKLSTFGVHA